jgi:lipid A 3-O-deacylase
LTRRERSLVSSFVRATIPLLLLSSLLAFPPSARADDAWVGNILEEDDFWAPDNRDRHYTHGIRYSLTTGDLHDRGWQRPFDWLAAELPVFAEPGGADVVRRYNLIPLGQNMYTPENGGLVNPDPRDRPYAGWLYGGVGLMQDTGGETFEELALKLGIVGPGSLANAAQTQYHLLINVGTFHGWHAQLHNEPAVDLFYGKKWRFWRALDSQGDWGWDVIPQAGLRVGNVYDYLEGGGLIRIGRNLRVDYGPPHIDLNTGADYLNPDRAKAGGIGVYLFAGAEGRLVGRNIFLDGNSFKASPSVAKLPAVGDLVSGLAATWGHVRLAYTYVYRSEEFSHQHAPDHYGSLDLSFHQPF